MGRARRHGSKRLAGAGPRDVQAPEQPLDRRLVGHEQAVAGHRERGVEPAYLERDAQPLVPAPRRDREQGLGRGLHRHVPPGPHVEDAPGSEHLAGREREREDPPGPGDYPAPGAPALLGRQLDRVRLEAGQVPGSGRGRQARDQDRVSGADSRCSRQ